MGLAHAAGLLFSSSCLPLSFMDALCYVLHRDGMQTWCPATSGQHEQWHKRIVGHALAPLLSSSLEDSSEQDNHQLTHLGPHNFCKLRRGGLGRCGQIQ